MRPGDYFVREEKANGGIIDCVKVSVFPLAASLLLSAAAASAQDVNDAEIARIVVMANQVDIDAGKLAARQASSVEVKKFANTMVAEHTGVNKQVAKLVARLGLTPQESGVSKDLYDGGQAHVRKLGGLKGTEFDKAYLDREVDFHVALLEAMDKTLIPGATNQQLKALLVRVRPAFVAHLEHAKVVQASASK
jgi:putative membrane protein